MRLRALNRREHTSVGFSLDSIYCHCSGLDWRWVSPILCATNGRNCPSLPRIANKHPYCLTRNVCRLSKCSGLLWLTRLGSNQELLPSAPVVVYSWVSKRQLSSWTLWLRHRNSPGRIHISVSSLLNEHHVRRLQWYERNSISPPYDLSGALQLWFPFSPSTPRIIPLPK